MKVFLFDSIQFLASMYHVQTAKQVLQLAHANLDDHLAKNNSNKKTVAAMIPERPPRNQRYGQSNTVDNDYGMSSLVSQTNRFGNSSSDSRQTEQLP